MTHNDDTNLSDKISLNMGKIIEEQLTIKANFFLKLYDEDGNLKDSREVHNTVTTAGKNAIADQIIAIPTLVKMGWMAIGTGSPAATLLGAEIARVAFDSKLRAGAIITVIATFPAGTGTGAITEAGTFDVVTANTVNMWMSALFGVVTKGALDIIVITWTLTVS